jgi:hypothetical protein
MDLVHAGRIPFILEDDFVEAARKAVAAVPA